MYPFF
jgi:hypothetical protein